MSKTSAVVATLLLALLLLLPLFSPPIGASVQTRHSVRILSVAHDGNVLIEKVSVDGSVYAINSTVSGFGTDPVVSYDGNFADFPTYIGNTPYSWWTGTSNPGEIYVYLDPQVAINTGSALAVIAALLGGLGGIESGVIPGIVAGAASALLSADYSTMYGADHAGDNSFTFWIPTDWYNIDVNLYFDRSLYIATMHYWWAAGIGAFEVGSR